MGANSAGAKFVHSPEARKIKNLKKQNNKLKGGYYHGASN
jgi:hypothetical protein